MRTTVGQRWQRRLLDPLTVEFPKDADLQCWTVEVVALAKGSFYIGQHAFQRRHHSPFAGEVEDAEKLTEGMGILFNVVWRLLMVSIEDPLETVLNTA